MMKRQMAILALAGGAICSSLVSAPAQASWMADREVNDLFVSSYQDDCPFSDEDVEEVVHGVLIRSRIKPASTWVSGDSSIAVSVDCLVDQNLWIYDIDVDLYRLNSAPDGSAMLTRQAGISWGVFGQGKKETILRSLQREVESAVTEYMKQVFDLAPDN